MKRYVLDASVAVKWYSARDENDVRKADDLLRMYGDGACSFMAPALIVYELANALRFNPHLTSGEVRKAVRSFLDLGIPLRDPADDAEDGVLLAFRHGFTVYDAAYAALAQAEGIPLLTADYKFHAKAKSMPLVLPLKDLVL